MSVVCEVQVYSKCYGQSINYRQLPIVHLSHRSYNYFNINC